MPSSSDDEDLKRAIKMSMVQDGPPPSSDDRGGSDEDEDLRRAIAMSLEDIKERNRPDDHEPSAWSSMVANKGTVLSNGYASDNSSTSLAKPTQPPSGAQPLSGLLGLDRRAMEQERLARLGKRKRSSSPEHAVKAATRASASSAKATAGTAPTNPKTTNPPRHSHRPPPTGVEFPNGVIKRTWANKHSRTPNDITISEVFQTPTAPPNIAVISGFQFDDRWVFSKLPPETTKQIWIMSAKGEDVQAKLLAEATESRIPNFKPHFPPMEGNVSSMHSKLMLIFHDSYLRVVVPTANMIKFDWGETNLDEKGEAWQAGVMENSVFLIDLPRREDGKVGKKDQITAFGKELLDFLEAQKVGKNVSEGVLKFDFSATQNVEFVHSIPGQQTAQFSDHTGLPGLANAVRRLGLHDLDILELDYAASSLGAVKPTFLSQLYAAARGQNSPSPSSRADLLSHIRIYFPTLSTVKHSTGGPDCGGIITLSRSYYEAPTFPKQCMRDYKSTRLGLLSHNKLLFARGRKKDGTPVAWCYVGSANLSESAWGSRSVLKNGSWGKMNIRNWECGVVVPVPVDVLGKLELKDGAVPPMSVFEGTVEVPFVFPAEEYGGKVPWYARENMGSA